MRFNILLPTFKLLLNFFSLLNGNTDRQMITLWSSCHQRNFGGFSNWRSMSSWRSSLGLGCLVVGSTETIFLLLHWSSMAWPAGGRRGRRGSGRGEDRDGVRGTRVTKGAGKVDSGEATTGKKVERGFAFMYPDRNKLSLQWCIFQILAFSWLTWQVPEPHFS